MTKLSMFAGILAPRRYPGGGLSTMPSFGFSGFCLVWGTEKGTLGVSQILAYWKGVVLGEEDQDGNRSEHPPLFESPFSAHHGQTSFH